jgi:ankyrin repeat protein
MFQYLGGKTKKPYTLEGGSAGAGFASGAGAAAGVVGVRAGAGVDSSAGAGTAAGAQAAAGVATPFPSADGESSSLIIKNNSVFKACQEGNLAVIKDFISSLLIDQIKLLDSEFLRMAIVYGHNDIVEFLVHSGVDINPIVKYRDFPLIEACAQGNLAVVDLLVRKGAGVNLSEERFSALHRACQYGHVDVVKYLLDNGANFDLKACNSFTPLLQVCHANYACYRYRRGGGTPTEIYPMERNSKPENFFQIVELLLARGASVNYVDSSDSNALMKAFDANDYELFNLLLEKGKPSVSLLHATNMYLLSNHDFKFSCLISKKILRPFHELPKIMNIEGLNDSCSDFLKEPAETINVDLAI